MATKMCALFKFWLLFVGTGYGFGFLFDQMSDGSGCPGLSMLCPPMCQKRDASGCLACDCAHINPAMPMNPYNNPINSGNPSTNTDPANPLSGASIPGSTGCDPKWLNCACTPLVDAASGCLVCKCGQINQQATSGTSAPPQIHVTSQQNIVTSHMTSPRSSVQVTSKSPVNTNPPTSAVISLKLPQTTATSMPTTTVQTTSQPTQSTGTTKVTFNTKLPIIATTPAPSSATSPPPTTTTQAAFLCPGIFNCSLDCYAGFVMDSNGCPKCQCAPVPTDLP